MPRKNLSAAPRVLIVAQDPWSRDLLAQLLLSVRGDAQVQCCSDGQSALEACRAHLPDLVLAEWALPVLDGLDLLRHLRRLRPTPPLPFVLLSERTDAASVREVLPWAPTAYVVSPYDPNNLQQRLRDLLLKPGQAVVDQAPKLPVGMCLQDFLESRRNSSHGAPLLGEVQAALSQRLQGGDVDLADLQREFARDPQITARLIAAANSAALHLGQPCQTLAQALPRLGVAQSLNLVLGMALQRSASLENEQLATLAQHYWARSQRTADLAFKLAKALDADAERCYSAGLLHCLGDLALLRCLQNWLLAGGELIDAQITAAMSEFAAGFGSALRTRWRLPLELRELIAATYQLGGGVYSREALVLSLAAQWARLSVDEDPEALLDSRAARLLRVSAEHLRAALPVEA